MTRARRPSIDSVDTEDALHSALQAEVCTTVAPDRAQEKDAEEGHVEEAADVGRWKATEEKAHATQQIQQSIGEGRGHSQQ